MVAVPYLTLGVVTVLVYRGMKKNEAFLRARGWAEQTGPPDERPGP